MQARLGDAELGGDIGIAEAVEAAGLGEALGDVEDLAGRSAAAAAGWRAEDEVNAGHLDNLPTSR